MHILQFLHQKIDQLSAEDLEKVVVYIAQLEQQAGSDPGLSVALNRSADYDAGRVQPVDKQAFWRNLQQRIGG